MKFLFLSFILWTTGCSGRYLFTIDKLLGRRNSNSKFLNQEEQTNAMKTKEMTDTIAYLNNEIISLKSNSCASNAILRQLRREKSKLKRDCASRTITIKKLVSEKEVLQRNMLKRIENEKSAVIVQMKKTIEVERRELLNKLNSSHSEEVLSLKTSIAQLEASSARASSTIELLKLKLLEITKSASTDSNILKEQQLLIVELRKSLGEKINNTSSSYVEDTACKENKLYTDEKIDILASGSDRIDADNKLHSDSDVKGDILRRGTDADNNITQVSNDINNIKTVTGSIPTSNNNNKNTVKTRSIRRPSRVSSATNRNNK